MSRFLFHKQNRCGKKRRREYFYTFIRIKHQSVQSNDPLRVSCEELFIYLYMQLAKDAWMVRARIFFFFFLIVSQRSFRSCGQFCYDCYPQSNRPSIITAEVLNEFSFRFFCKLSLCVSNTTFLKSSPSPTNVVH